MCRAIKTLANFTPAATDDEIRASALQFVRKLSGTNKPSRANEAAFNLAIEEVTDSARRLIHSLQTTAPPRNRGSAERSRRWSPLRDSPRDNHRPHLGQDGVRTGLGRSDGCGSGMDICR